MVHLVSHLLDKALELINLGVPLLFLSLLALLLGEILDLLFELRNQTILGVDIMFERIKFFLSLLIDCLELF